jgi:hypothetical protein
MAQVHRTVVEILMGNSNKNSRDFNRQAVGS